MTQGAASTARRPPLRRRQHGGFLVGLIIGLLIGLALSLAVALYVTKVPVPFINKVPQRSAEQEAAQAEKNRNWEPNAPLAGKGAVRAPAAASATASPGVPAAPPVAAATPPAPTTSPTPAAAPAKPAATAASGAEAFTYFVQAGAFTRSEDAEQQRASLALIGMTARITEREQAGRPMYRVRLGPFERKEEADAVKEKLAASSIESALVRVQR